VVIEQLDNQAQAATVEMARLGFQPSGEVAAFITGSLGKWSKRVADHRDYRRFVISSFFRLCLRRQG
jgi:hypothetical protein